ncbi:MAG: trypsin-like peptidase domain-containing protein [Actinomycetota bacterium]|nr:trypsin-like peptidase domain-containing protein [Actinomycetota bacterium]
MVNIQDDFEQNQLFKETTLITDKKKEKKSVSSNTRSIILTSLITSSLIISSLYFLGFFDEVVIPPQETITITETVKEKELVIPRIDSSEIVTVAEIATKTIVQIQVGFLNEDGEFIGQGGGSGVVLTNDGLIITNHHVLDMEEITIEPVNTEVRVVFEDGKMYGGEIVGSDKLTDVGLIKIGANGLSPILIGKSSKLVVGDIAVAIGHPLTLGAEPTVTTGIISALNRRLDVGNDSQAVTLFGLIQTDAPITRGSSGGALLNQKGELVGITTAIATADVGAEGLGFAIPVDLALSIVDDLLKDGTVLHSFLGILGTQNFDTAEDGARIFAGVKIEELYGPANDVYAIGKAGALPGDIIRSLDGTKIKTLDQLITLLRARRAGEKVTIEILRGEEVIELVFELDLRPSDI